jgi:hypothetical protein
MFADIAVDIEYSYLKCAECRVGIAAVSDEDWAGVGTGAR